MNAASNVVPILADTATDTAAKDINEQHRLARQSAETAVEHAIRCGELLIAQKAGAAHGTFGRWIESNCEFSQATANNYMKAAQNPNALGNSLRSLYRSGRQVEQTTALAGHDEQQDDDVDDLDHGDDRDEDRVGADDDREDDRGDDDAASAATSAHVRLSRTDRRSLQHSPQLRDHYLAVQAVDRSETKAKLKLKRAIEAADVEHAAARAALRAERADRKP